MQREKEITYASLVWLHMHHWCLHMIGPNGFLWKVSLTIIVPDYMNFNDIPIFMQWKNAFPYHCDPPWCKKLDHISIFVQWTNVFHIRVAILDIFTILIRIVDEWDFPMTVVEGIEAKKKWNTNKDLWLNMHGGPFEYTKHCWFHGV